MNRLSLLRKYYLYSVIGLAIIAISIAAYLSYSMKSSAGTAEFIGIVYVAIFLSLVVLHIFLFKGVAKVSDELTVQNNKLVESKKQAEEALRKLDYSYRETIAAATASIDARDAYTAGHSKRVADIACKVGRKLGLEDSQLECLELAALLHDIGKIGIPDYILNKRGKFNEIEFQKIREHPTIGCSILEKIKFLSPMLPAILYHHERPDGKGYPEGLKADEIPIGASVLAIADTYDAMTSDRPYRSALSHESAVEELKKLKGMQFKKEVVDAFLKINIQNYNEAKKYPPLL